MPSWLELLRSGEKVSGVERADTRHAGIPPMLMGLGHSPSSVTGPDGRRGVRLSGLETKNSDLVLMTEGPRRWGGDVVACVVVFG